MFDLYDGICSAEDLVGMESANITIDKCLLALDAFNESYELDCREMELKCMMESGSNEELMEFYEEASEKLDAKKESILKRAWKALKELIRKIKEAIFGRNVKPECNPNDIVEVTKPFAKFVNGIKSAWAAAKPAILNIGKSLKNHKGVIALIALLFVGYQTTYGNKKRMEKMEKKRIIEAEKITKDVIDTIEEIAEKASANVNSASEDNVEILRKISEGVKNQSKSLTEALSQASLVTSKMDRRELEYTLLAQRPMRVDRQGNLSNSDINYIKTLRGYTDKDLRDTVDVHAALGVINKNLADFAKNF